MGEGGAVAGEGEGVAVGAVGVAAAEGVAACGAARTRLGCTHRTRGAVRSACLRREGTFGRKGRSGPCSAAYVSKYGGDIFCAWDARTNLTSLPNLPSLGSTAGALVLLGRTNLTSQPNLTGSCTFV